MKFYYIYVYQYTKLRFITPMLLYKFKQKKTDDKVTGILSYEESLKTYNYYNKCSHQNNTDYRVRAL